MPCMRVTSLSLLALLALSGCATSGSDSKPAAKADPAVTAAPAAATGGRCDSQLAQFAIGQTASSALLEQAQQRSGSQIARVLRPKDVITLEYRSERLNLNVNEQGVVTRVNCG